MPETVKTVTWYISGLVQGVGYRYFALRQAMALGLIGTVQNLPDGRVKVVAQGNPDILSSFHALLSEGPRGGLVKDILEDRAEPDEKYFQGFKVTY